MIDLKKLCNELGIIYKDYANYQFGAVLDKTNEVHIIEHNSKIVCYFKSVTINKKNHIEFYDLVEVPFGESNYDKIKKNIANVLKDYKKILIKLKVKELDNDFV